MKRFATRSLVVLALLTLVVGIAGLSPAPAEATDCTVTVTAPDSIQAAVDAAASGDVVCLSGTFSQSVVFGPEDSGITLSAADGASPVLDGTGPADFGTTLLVDAIVLLDGVTGVTIEGLEIRNYSPSASPCCGQGNAIQAWDVDTSNITVRKNNMHDNSWNAVLVGSEGGYAHTGWAVHHNTATNNGFAQIELTNASSSSVHNNTATSGNTAGSIGILVQGRNTVASSGLVVAQGVSVKNNTVSATKTVDFGDGPVDYRIGVYVLALASGPVSPFPGITGAEAELRDVSVGSNQITAGRRGVAVRGFTGSPYTGAGRAINTALVRNDITCTDDTDSDDVGILVLGPDTINTKVVNNDYSGCSPNVLDTGTDTKEPPVPANPS